MEAFTKRPVMALLNDFPDTECRFVEWQDAESAIRHVDVLYPGRYTVFRDASDRVFLQDEDESRGGGPSGRRFPRPVKF